MDCLRPRSPKPPALPTTMPGANGTSRGLPSRPAVGSGACGLYRLGLSQVVTQMKAAVPSPVHLDQHDPAAESQQTTQTPIIRPLAAQVTRRIHRLFLGSGRGCSDIRGGAFVYPAMSLGEVLLAGLIPVLVGGHLDQLAVEKREPAPRGLDPRADRLRRVPP